LNSWPVERLAAVFAEYGDERRARALAREVLRRRLSAPFVQSDDYVNAIRAVLGPRSGPAHFARLFQALRIAVNGELDQVATALPAFRDALVAGGRLGVITYHSGEDRIVKHLFREWSRACICPPRQPVCTCRGRPLGRVLTKKPVVPGAAEVAANPRARSAQFRAFEVADA
jgi:16S rRNA (cytosine1402-N4)-methyltransferase